MTIVRLRDVLKSRSRRRSRLSRLINQIEYDSETTKIVQALLPENEASHCVGASIKGKVVVLMVDSAAWANRLRFRKKTLLSDLRQIQRFAVVQDIIVVTNSTVGELLRNRAQD